MASLPPHPLHLSSPPPRRLLRLGLSAAACAFCVGAWAWGIGCQQSPRFAGGGEADRSDAGWQAPVFEPQLTPAKIPERVPIPEPRVANAPRSWPADWSPPGRHRAWRWIVIHHSATTVGGAQRFDDLHRNRNGWDELGYHFVIGNGTDTRNGQVETGGRWLKQKHGAHARTGDNRYNELGIGICLVGNFDQQRPTEEQLRTLATLTAYLMQKYDIPASNVIRHGDVGVTACPGRMLDVDGLRRVASRAVSQGFAADVARTNVASRP